MKFQSIALALLIGSTPAVAALVATPATTINSMSTYGDGDVIFSTANPTAGCEDGYFFSKTDPGHSAMLANLVSAFHAKTSVVVYGSSELRWQGSSGKFCKLYTIQARA